MHYSIPDNVVILLFDKFKYVKFYGLQSAEFANLLILFALRKLHLISDIPYCISTGGAGFPSYFRYPQFESSGMSSSASATL